MRLIFLFCFIGLLAQLPLFAPLFAYTPFTTGNDVVAFLKVDQRPLALVSTSSRPHVEKIWLLIEGFNLGDGHQWQPVFETLIRKNQTVYFHRLWRAKSLKRNRALMLQSFRTISARHPGIPLEIVAYSASGGAALLAYQDWAEKDRLSRLSTVASPLSGYDVPPAALPFVAMGVGSYTMQVARGFSSHFKFSELTQCQHFVNTDCSLDRHACPKGPFSNTQLVHFMPCGDFNVQTRRLGHAEILLQAVEELLPLGSK